MTAGTSKSEYLNLTVNELFHKIDSLTKECDGANARISELEAKLEETEQMLHHHEKRAAAVKENEKEIAMTSQTQAQAQAQAQIKPAMKSKTKIPTKPSIPTKASVKSSAASNSNGSKRKKPATTAAVSNSSAGSRSSRRSRLKISSKITGSGFHCAHCDAVLPFEGTEKTIVKNVGEDAYNRFPAQKCSRCDGISQYVTSSGGVLLVPGKKSW